MGYRRPPEARSTPGPGCASQDRIGVSPASPPTYRFGRSLSTPGVGIKWVDSRYRLDEVLRRESGAVKGVGGDATLVGACEEKEDIMDKRRTAGLVMPGRPVNHHAVLGRKRIPNLANSSLLSLRRSCSFASLSLE